MELVFSHISVLSFVFFAVFIKDMSLYLSVSMCMYFILFTKEKPTKILTNIQID